MVNEGIYSGRVLLYSTATVEPGEEVPTSCVSVMRARRFRQTSGKKILTSSPFGLQVVNIGFPVGKTTQKRLSPLDGGPASDSAGVWDTRQTGELSDHRIQNLGMESRSRQQALNPINRFKDDNLQAIITS